MDSLKGILISLTLGFFMGTSSMVLGACLASRAVAGKGLLSPLDPKGDVFNVETPDDVALFPEDIVNEAEEHILQKTNRFLERLNSVPEDK